MTNYQFNYQSAISNFQFQIQSPIVIRPIAGIAQCGQSPIEWRNA
jgi:hypothetical protein